MKRKKLGIALGVLLCAIAGAGGIWAFAAAETSVTNRLSTSVVDIKLETYKETGEREVPFTEKDRNIQMMPGMVLSQIPKITNKAIDCYVRAGIAIEGKREVERPLSLEDISGFSKDWVRHGEYYYYTKVLKHGEEASLFRTITIPKEWDTQYDADGVADYYTLNDWDITIKVDAVQAANFTPDLGKEDPWGTEGEDYVIQECIHEDGYELTAYQKREPLELTVVYEGESRKLIASPEDFFSSLPKLVPGDEKEGVFSMKNKGEKKQDFYVRTEILEEKDILEKIRLKIDTGGETIYEGPLNAEKLNGYSKLCSLEKGESQDVAFRITVPKELDNRYTLNDCKVKWMFKTAEEPEHAVPVKTGDTLWQDAVPYILALAGAGGLVIAVIRKKRRKKC